MKRPSSSRRILRPSRTRASASTAIAAGLVEQGEETEHRAHEDVPDPNCSICRNNLPFDLPAELYQKLANGEVVVFAGAGVSTEGQSVFPMTLFEDVCQKCGVDPSSGIAFPDAMSLLEAKSGRAELLRVIRDRFAYVHAFPELYRASTRFHRQLSTIYLIDTIVTTNWDDYFEAECGALPFVTAEDFAFWSVPGRKVFKLHGSVNSYGSIVAARSDYEESYKGLEGGLIGANLKMMLATKTIIYMGFSFSDDDFLRIHRFLSSEMKGMLPQSYIVTLDKASDARFRSEGLSPIYTDATFFLSEIKRRLVSEHRMLPDQRFSGVRDFLEEMTDRHFELTDEIDRRKHPEALYCSAYQDGLIHALERFLSLRNSGHYSNSANLLRTEMAYQKLRKKRLRSQQYLQVAYIDGYTNGHLFLLADDDFRDLVPRYYVYGDGGSILTLRAYKRIAKRAAILHKTAVKLAEKTIARFPGNVVLHHTPFIS